MKVRREQAEPSSFPIVPLLPLPPPIGLAVDFSFGICCLCTTANRNNKKQFIYKENKHPVVAVHFSSCELANLLSVGGSHRQAEGGV